MRYVDVCAVGLFVCFLTEIACIFLQELLDPEKGYVKDDSIILEVKVDADAPHGVRFVTSKLVGLALW